MADGDLLDDVELDAEEGLAEKKQRVGVLDSDEDG
jgi:hypothetical protein